MFVGNSIPTRISFHAWWICCLGGFRQAGGPAIAAKIVKCFGAGDSPLRYRINQLGGQSKQRNGYCRRNCSTRFMLGEGGAEKIEEQG